MLCLTGAMLVVPGSLSSDCRPVPVVSALFWHAAGVAANLGMGLFVSLRQR